MTIFEKSVLNIQKSVKQLSAVALTLSERAKTEIAVVRLKMKIDEIQSQIDEQHRVIGRAVETLKNSDPQQASLEPLLRDERIEAAFNEIAERKKELEDLKQDVENVQDAVVDEVEQKGEDAVE